MTFTDPIGTGLKPERVDQGVDYGGVGNLYALGAGTVANTANSGWPGGTFLTIRLDDTGNYVYYAEDVQPSVKVGDTVQVGQLIGKATGGPEGIEIGWAAPPGTGNTMASQAGQTKAGLAKGDPGAFPTAYGLDMSKLIQALGGPPGTVNGTVQGTVPAGFDTAVSANQATLASFNPIDPSTWVPTVVGDAISFLNPIPRIEDALGIPSFKDILMRLGLILLGGILIIVGLFVIVGKSNMLTAVEGGAAIAAPEAAPEIAAEHQSRETADNQ